MGTAWTGPDIVRKEAEYALYSSASRAVLLDCAVQWEQERTEATALRDENATLLRLLMPSGKASLLEHIRLLERLVKAQDTLLVAYRIGGPARVGSAIDEIGICKRKLAKLSLSDPGVET